MLRKNPEFRPFFLLQVSKRFMRIAIRVRAGKFFG
jgi:hypothetical protein